MNARHLILLAGVAGCAASMSGPRTDVQSTFRETAAATIVGTSSGRSVQATADIENVGGSQQSIAWGVDCGGSGALTLNVYRFNGDTRTLVWTSAALKRVLGCPTRLVQLSLEPGEHAQPQFAIAVSSILGDSLPAGTYALGVIARTTPALDAEVPAGTLSLTDTLVVPPGTDLDGTWTGSAKGLSFSLTLKWTADSVSGTGSYTAADTNSFGCGGGTLRGSGTLKYVAQRTQDRFQGAMLVSGGWSPPFGGVLLDQRTIAGSFMSIDAGACYLTLTRQ